MTIIGLTGFLCPRRDKVHDFRIGSPQTIDPTLYTGHQNMPQERSRYQEKIIKNYYQNRDAIGLQKAQEAVTELYLSEGKKRETVWKRLTSHLEKVGLPPKQIAHLRSEDSPELVLEALKKFI
ncbi:MAG: hypothetical protein VXZ38_12300 [Planctomycetota bacterium]|nr:hypothetical protein [Planctomycetota bacterium]